MTLKEAKAQIRRAMAESMKNAKELSKKAPKGKPSEPASWYYGHHYGLKLALSVLRGSTEKA